MRMPNVQQQQNEAADYERARSQGGKATRLEREVLEFVDVRSNYAFFKRDDRPENSVYMNAEDTLLNNGSLVGVDLSRLFHIRDFAMVSVHRSLDVSQSR